MQFILENKPLLVGLHLGFAIVGIDLLLWLLGELVANSKQMQRIRAVSLGALLSFVFSWMVGGYYYVKYYGPLVKPIIKASATPWAHSVAMEAKEHIFLFLIPLCLTIFFITMLGREELNEAATKKSLKKLVVITVILALAIGAMGFIISAAARWA